MLRKASLGTLPEIATKAVRLLVENNPIQWHSGFFVSVTGYPIVSPQRCSVTPLEWKFQWDFKSVLKTVKIKTSSTASFTRTLLVHLIQFLSSKARMAKMEKDWNLKKLANISNLDMISIIPRMLKIWKWTAFTGKIHLILYFWWWI